MRKFTVSLTLSVGLALVGCSTLVPLTPSPETASPQAQPAYEPGDLVLRLQVGDSRMLQAGGDPVAVYDASDIAKLVITPFLKVGDAFVPMSTTGKPTTEGAGDRLTISTTNRHQRTFVFKNLPHHQTYRFQAQAFDAQGNLISKDADSVSDVEFTNFSYAPTANIQLRLLDKPFVATAKATVSFADGLGGSDHVLVELFKKGTPDVKVGTSVRIEAADIGTGRTLALGGLAPNTTYVLKAEARAADETVLASGSVEWEVGNDQELVTKTLELSFEPMVTTVSGGAAGFEDNVPAALATFNSPRSMVLGSDGAVYVADNSNNCIRRLDLAGNVTTWATLTPGSPDGLVRDASGNLFATSATRYYVYKISGQNSVSPYAGNGTQSGTDALEYPNGICLDPQGNLYVTQWNAILRYTGPGQRTTFATISKVNPGDMFNPNLYGLLSDPQGNIYVGDPNNGRILKVSPAGAVETFAGVATRGIQDGPVETAQLSNPMWLARSGNTLYFSDNGRVRQIKDGVVTTLAGGPAISGTPYRDGKGSDARFGSYIGGLVVLPDGNLLVSDTHNHRIRKITLPATN